MSSRSVGAGVSEDIPARLDFHDLLHMDVLVGDLEITIDLDVIVGVAADQDQRALLVEEPRSEAGARTDQITVP